MSLPPETGDYVCRHCGVRGSHVCASTYWNGTQSLIDADIHNPDYVSVASRHMAHYTQCGCLSDTDKCCVSSCPCHDKARHTDIISEDYVLPPGHVLHWDGPFNEVYCEWCDCGWSAFTYARTAETSIGTAFDRHRRHVMAAEEHNRRSGRTT